MKRTLSQTLSSSSSQESRFANPRHSKASARNTPASTPDKYNKPNNTRDDATLFQQKLYKSGQIHDRSSTFVGLYSPIATAKQLQTTPEFKDASHRIAAWRTPSKSQRSVIPGSGGVLETGFDDDGESRAGRVLEKVLLDLGVQGSVVVARWYGGVLLGPVRFKHIEDVAKEAIGLWMAEMKQEQNEADAKRRKIEDEKNEEEQKRNLVEALTKRDSSIDILRQLLKDKITQPQAQSPGHKDEESTKKIESAVQSTAVIALSSAAPISSQSPSKATPNYSAMPLARLKMLEKARDATIAAVLKKLDEVDQQQTAALPPDVT